MKRCRVSILIPMFFLVCMLLSCCVSAADAHDVSVLNGRSMLIFGDSLTTGHELTDLSKSWPNRLASEYGVKITNTSVTGSTYSKSHDYAGTSWADYVVGGCYKPMCDRAIPAGYYDVIFIESGGNDASCCAPFANDLASTDPYTFEGALNTIINRLSAAHPEALLLGMTAWEACPENPNNQVGLGGDVYNEVAMQVFAYRGIACFEACDPDISGIHPADPEFRARYFTGTPGDDDFYHLNEDGQALFLPTIAHWFATQVEDHNGATAILHGWVYENEHWYYYESGSPVCSGWKKIDGYWYYFNDNGVMQTGWLRDGGVWYYLRSSGAMATGWVKVGGYWYYLRSSGAMQTGWLKDGAWYYLKSNGTMAYNERLRIDGIYYRFSASGAWIGS